MYLAKYSNIGLIDYKESWDLQDKLQKGLYASREIDFDTAGEIIFCEHPHVFTLGNSGDRSNLLIGDNLLNQVGATFYKSNRGGDITYHGPGQLVGYPILDLEKLRMGTKEYVNTIEEAIIRTLADFSIHGTRLERAAGVWIEADTTLARKICSIGVKVSRAITMHGFALNVNTDLSYFSYINPCGFTDKGVSSMQKELGKRMNFIEVQEKLKIHIFKLLQLELKKK